MKAGFFMSTKVPIGTSIDIQGNSCYIDTMPTHPAPQNAGQYFELPGSGQGLSSQPEA